MFDEEARPTSWRAQETSIEESGGETGALVFVERVCFWALGLLMAGSLVVWSLPSLGPSNIRTTETAARTMQMAMTLFLVDNPGECPTLTQLVEEQYIDRSTRLTDAWDVPFRLTCHGRDVRAASAGPDGSFGTDDDIVTRNHRRFAAESHRIAAR